jgi:hypothetical protein
MFRAFGRVLAGLSVSLTLAGGVMAETKPSVAELGAAPKSFLFVGNSFYYYNNSMHSYFIDIVRAGDREHARQYRATSATISGSGLNWHDMEGYFNAGMASYSFDENNKVTFNKLDKPFDVVIMNDCSQCPIHPDLSGLFREYAKKHSDTVRKHGAIPVLFMTWAYQDKPEMTEQLAEAYTSVGNENNVLVIPAGLAFADALKKRPDLVMYQKDKRHPSLIGTYLGAATIYSALYGKPANGAPAVPGIDPELAGFLQNVAWETTQQYYSRKRADMPESRPQPR